jgi:hypothetical protein
MRVMNVAVRNTVFAERKVDAFVSQILGSPMDFVVRAKEGKNPGVHFLLFGDFGVNTLSQGLLAEKKLHRTKTGCYPEIHSRHEPCDKGNCAAAEFR